MSSCLSFSQAFGEDEDRRCFRSPSVQRRRPFDNPGILLAAVLLITLSNELNFTNMVFLCSQGEEADCFYIVESGMVKIMIKSKVSVVVIKM